MKLITYKQKNITKFGCLISKNHVVDLSTKFKYKNLNDFIEKGGYREKEITEYLNLNIENFIQVKDIEIVAPIQPRSLRDAYAFRQHVETSRKNRGLDMINEFDDFPVYYYSNSDAIFGPGNIKIDNAFMINLDFELEVAIVISKEGKNICCHEADQYIAGFMIMNDFSARDIQMKEMKLNLGPAKGKDFATSIGPFLITIDELRDNIIETDKGNQYDLQMQCIINNEIISNDNLKNMSWSFSQIIERVSMGTTIYPGDVIGSGTCATGCFLELNQSSNTRWLKKDDKIELKVEKLGSLINIIK